MYVLAPSPHPPLPAESQCEHSCQCVRSFDLQCLCSIFFLPNTGHVLRYNPSLQQAILQFDEPLQATDPKPALGQVELRPEVRSLRFWLLLLAQSLARARAFL